MQNMFIAFLALGTFLTGAQANDGSVGCFKKNFRNFPTNLHVGTVTECAEKCQEVFYKWVPEGFQKRFRTSSNQIRDSVLGMLLFRVHLVVVPILIQRRNSIRPNATFAVARILPNSAVEMMLRVTMRLISKFPGLHSILRWIWVQSKTPPWQSSGIHQNPKIFS